MGSSVAMSVLDTENTLCISNREFISDFSPPANSGSFYTPISGAINPGLGTLFPWLSQIALYYEEYEFEQLIFEFKSMVTEGNQNAQGNLIMATQYNALNPLFTSKTQMENYDYANSSKVTQNSFHGVECNPQLNAAAALYVRSGTVPTGQDAKTYDLGLFQIAISNAYQAANINLGELWVSYKIKLRKTKLILPGNDLSPVVWNAVYSFTVTAFANLFNSIITRIINTNTVADVTANGSNKLTFPSYIIGGVYSVVLTLLNASNIGYTMTVPNSFTNCQLCTFSNNQFGPVPSSSSTISGETLYFYVIVTGPSPTITIPTPTGTLVSSTSGVLFINQVSSSIT
jgi:Viral coat protein (S domain)